MIDAFSKTERYSLKLKCQTLFAEAVCCSKVRLFEVRCLKLFRSGLKNAKANLAFAGFAFVGSPVREEGQNQMRKQQYLRLRRFLRITKEILIIILMIQAIIKI